MYLRTLLVSSPWSSSLFWNSLFFHSISVCDHLLHISAKCLCRLLAYVLVCHIYKRMNKALADQSLKYDRTGILKWNVFMAKIKITNLQVMYVLWLTMNPVQTSINGILSLNYTYLCWFYKKSIRLSIMHVWLSHDKPCKVHTTTHLLGHLKITNKIHHLCVRWNIAILNTQRPEKYKVGDNMM